MYLTFSGNEYACLIQVACLIEVATMTDFTVCSQRMTSLESPSVDIISSLLLF